MYYLKNREQGSEYYSKNCAVVLFLVSYRTREPVVSEDETEYYIIRRVEQTREIMPMLFLPSKQIKEKVFVSLAKNLTLKKVKKEYL